MKKVLVRRFEHFKGKEYLGTLVVFDDKGNLLYNCKTLELSWEENKTSVSCIPCGTYELVFEYSKAFDRFLWEIKGVPYRSECKIHAANYEEQLEGCIAVGLRHADINADGVIDITSSGHALDALNKIMHPDSKAIIEIVQGYGTM